MKLRQRLSQRQSQSLVMTQELQQAIRLLQMSNLELQAFIAQEVETNPLLELAEPGMEADMEADLEDGREALEAPRTQERAEQEMARRDEPREAAPEGADLATTLAEPAAPEARVAHLDMDLGEVFDGDGPADAPVSAGEAGGRDWRGGARRGEELPAGLEARLCSRKSLREHLLEQVGLLGLDDTARAIAAHLVARLDADGYLREPVEEIAAQLGVREREVENVLAVLQGLEPAGVCARNLAECFRLQLADMGELSRSMETLLDNLELLARREFEKLATLCGVAPGELPAMAERLRRLDPRPGAALGAPEPQVVVADVIVRAAPDGSWLVELNGETLPRVLVNNQYRAIVAGGGMRERDKVFIHDCAQRASWLVKSLDQRARTILAVAREIVRRQDGFLLHGVRALKPLTLKQVAEAVDMHESTISRVVANKHMATPRGILPMRYFFSAAIAASGGEEAVSAEAVRQRIRELIEAEPPQAVLSDDAIVAALRREGIEIARRTVAKYREAMGIPSSVRRRREKRLLARATRG